LEKYFKTMIYQDQIRNTLQTLPCSMDFLGAVSGISTTKLSRFLKDIAPLSGPELAGLMDTIEQLRGLARDASPLPLAFMNARVISGLIAKRRAGLRIVPILVGPDEVVEQIEIEMTASARQ
jgi:hypothetical protein